MTVLPPITVASYNMRKAVGLDGRRDPQRVLKVLTEIGADIVALQEADKRVGTRGAAVPHAMIDDHGLYRALNFNVSHKKLFDRLPDGFIDRIPANSLAAPLKKLDFRNLGWHGNAILVKSDVEILDVEAIDLPMIEPRGAVMGELRVRGVDLRVIGMHLDLSGLRRRRQYLRSSSISSNATRSCRPLSWVTPTWRPRDGASVTRRALRGRAMRANLPQPEAGRRARSDHRRPPLHDHRIWRSHSEAAPRLGPSADLGEVFGLPPVIFARSVGAESTIHPHRLAIFDHSASGDLDRASAGGPASASSLRISSSAPISWAIASLTAEAAAPSPMAEATPEPKKYFSSNSPWSDSRYLFDVTRLTVDSCIPIASATSRRVIGFIALTPWVKKARCRSTMALTTLTIVRARWSSAFTSQRRFEGILSQARDALSWGPCLSSA